MKIKNLLFIFICAAGVTSAKASFAGEAVRSAPVIQKTGSSMKLPYETIEHMLESDSALDKLIEKNVLPRFRRMHGCLGPNAEKDSPSHRQASSAMKCSDLLTYKSARAKSEDIAKSCKRDCLKSTVKNATGKSAAAIEKCLTESCEKTCDFKNISQKVELDSFIRGSIDQNGDDAQSM